MLLPICLVVLAAEPWPLVNPDFAQVDVQGQPAGWRHGEHDGGQYTFSALTEEGVSFVRISGATPAGRAYWSQSIGPLPAPAAFTISFRYRGTGAQMDGFLRLRDGRDAAVEVSMHSWRQAPIANAWTAFEQTFAVPKPAREAAGGVRPELIIYARGVGTVDYTGFRIEPLERYTPDWPTTIQPLAMPYRPADKQVNQQNPPDFSWPPVGGTEGYELEVSRTAAFEQVAHAAAPTHNFWSFDTTFEPGVWYWRVRALVGENRTAWSPVRRFRIDPDAWPFPPECRGDAGQGTAAAPADLGHAGDAGRVPGPGRRAAPGVVRESGAGRAGLAGHPAAGRADLPVQGQRPQDGGVDCRA